MPFGIVLRETVIVVARLWIIVVAAKFAASAVHFRHATGRSAILFRHCLAVCSRSKRGLETAKGIQTPSDVVMIQQQKPCFPDKRIIACGLVPRTALQASLDKEV